MRSELRDANAANAKIEAEREASAAEFERLRKEVHSASTLLQV